MTRSDRETQPISPMSAGPTYGPTCVSYRGRRVSIEVNSIHRIVGAKYPFHLPSDPRLAFLEVGTFVRPVIVAVEDDNPCVLKCLIPACGKPNKT